MGMTYGFEETKQEIAHMDVLKASKDISVLSQVFEI
jgi:hypothetical protein